MTTPGNAAPPLTVGCAVYRSPEAGLRRSLDSVLGQTMGDFRVVICDNSPDDATGRICRSYVDADERVSYHRNRVNLGAYPNFQRTLQFADTPYFKWVADDDVIDPAYFARCLAVLEDDPGAALCYSRVETRRPDGAPVPEDVRGNITATQDDPESRFLGVLNHSWKANGYYGIFRTEHLRRLHPASDDCVRLADILLLAEVALYGRIHQVPDALITSTLQEKDWLDREKLNAQQYARCFGAKPFRGITFPNCLFAWELLQAVRYADLAPAAKDRLYGAVPALVEKRIGGLWAKEIRRAVMLVLDQRVFHDWGAPADPLAEGLRWHERPGLYRFHAAELLQRLEQVQHVWPRYPEPGLQTARAMLLIMVDRVPEAHAALGLELARFPEYAPARQLRRNLEAAAAASSASEPAPATAVTPTSATS